MILQYITISFFELIKNFSTKCQPKPVNYHKLEEHRAGVVVVVAPGTRKTRSLDSSGRPLGPGSGNLVVEPGIAGAVEQLKLSVKQADQIRKRHRD